MTQTIDLSSYIASNTKFKSKTIKVNKLTDTQQFDTSGAISGQVEVVKKGGKLVVNVYKQAGIVDYTYRKVITSYGHKGKSGYPRWITTMYLAQDGSFIDQDTAFKHVSKPGKSSTKYYVYKNGKLYKTVKSTDDFANYTSSGTPTVSKSLLGTYTITNASEVAEGIKILVNGEDILAKVWEITGNSSGYFAGSDLNEKAYSTAKNETFAMGKGTDTIYFTNDSTYGKDTVRLSNNSALTLSLGNSYTVEVQRDAKGNLKSSDVIVHIGGEGDPYGKITLKNYLKMNSTSVNINGNDINELLAGATLGSSSATSKQTLVGTSLDEIFYCGTKNDVVVTGGGKDTIHTGTGNATIKINSGGQKDINVSSGSVTTVTRVNPYGTGTAYLKFTSNDLQYVKDGSNLIIEQGGQKTTVVKSFFGGTGFNKTYASDDDTNLGARITDSDIKLLVDKKDTSAVTVKGSKYADIIKGGKRTNYIYADNGNNDIYVSEERIGKTKIKAGDGNDKYYLQNGFSNAKNTFIVADNGGTDSIIISNGTTLFSYFNVNYNKKTGVYTTESTLHFLDKNAVQSAAKVKKAVSSSEKLTIQNAITTTNSVVNEGKGWIESINGSRSISTIDDIASDVASWLADKGYSSVTQALGKADETSLHNLMSLYMANTI